MLKAGTLPTLISVVISAVCAAQGQSSSCPYGRQSSHSFSNIRGFSNYGIIGPPPAQVQDFGATAINPNTSTSITVQWKFESTNPTNYHFYNGDVGTTTKNSLSLDAYSDSAQNSYRDVNTPGWLFPPTNTNNNYDVTGTMTVSSIGGETFYFQNVANLVSPIGVGNSTDEAFKDAWNHYDKYIDVCWDSNINRFVVPWANLFLNTGDWIRGSQTSAKFTNGGLYSNIDFTLYNHLNAAGAHEHDGVACNSTNEGYLSGVFSVANGASTTINAFTDLPHPGLSNRTGVRWRHDTGLTIAVSQSPSGLTVDVRIFPNTSNNPRCTP